MGQPIRKDGPESHIATKQGTPTMGGLFIIAATVIATCLWADMTNQYIYLCLFVILAFGFLGLVDDYLKIIKRNTDGLSGKQKLFWQTIIALIAIYFVIDQSPEQYQNKLTVPFFKKLLLDLGLFFVPFAVIVIVGSANAVNLTDGLDGLAIMPVVIAASCFAFISYLIGNSIFANYLHLHYIPGAGEMAIFLSSIVGAGLGFLWYNSQPAQIFMGDVGSLALGSSIGIVSVIAKQEIVLSIIGGLFVIEALSVIIQVYYFKITKGKRFFLMAPLHHHFEKKGWSEATVVTRFWIISLMFALLGLATLKIR